MTVRRMGKMEFAASKPAVLEKVRQVLAAHDEYRRVRVDSAGGTVTTSVQANMFILPVRMTITLAENEGGTGLSVTAQSNPLVLGTSFGLYDTYIKRFYNRLAQATGGNSQLLGIESASAPADNRQTLILLALFLLLALAMLAFPGIFNIGGPVVIAMIVILLFAMFAVIRGWVNR